MKLLEAKVKRYEGLANEPTLELTVDELPSQDSHVYDAKRFDDGTMYYSQTNEGAVSFFAHRPDHEAGFGGHVFHLKMFDGTERDIKGPWSSRAGAMNHFFPHCVDVIINGQSVAISLMLAYEAAKMAGVKLEMIERRNDIVYVIRG